VFCRAIRLGLMCIEGVCMKVGIMHMCHVTVFGRQNQIMNLFLCDFVL
jgi:hypothetical protein